MICQTNHSAVETVCKKLKTDNTSNNAAADVVADLFNSSSPVTVDEVDKYTSGTKYITICCTSVKANLMPGEDFATKQSTN